MLGNVDRLFRSEKGWLAKVAGAGLAGLWIAVKVAQRVNHPSPWVKLFCVLVPTSIVMLIAVALIRADTVRCRIRAEEHVGLISYVLFGAGIWSLLFWIVLVLLAGVPLAIVIGNLTAGRPPG